ncbi:hypothetical protein IW261DRAFT_1482382 [Armillaria novae-zelandiae]|uniref:F-box domain-containing protein n=1 Tax=Armillaria novae-zelandiae TaxID=153914 RepID=A0AA39U9J6_9AGAR|nr:hypothetical protein IW261DRAFT_1482382 [Armillaria novae-zelandiae]
MSSIPKINQLPDELLTLIYATGLRDLPSDQHQPLLALICSVCRHWRDVAIAASELWTTIYITLGRHLPATQAFLERSKGRLIDVYIRAVNTNRPIIARDAATITTITAPHISRVRTLVMSLSQYKVYTTFSDTYRSISATNLANLSIHLRRDIWQSETFPPLFASANSLCHFDTQGNFLNVVPSRTSLTTLELGNYSPIHTELQDLFNTSPYLETLVLHGFDVTNILARYADAAPIAITAPTSLKSLALNLYRSHGASTTPCCVLCSLSMPCLEYLEVVGTFGLDVDIDLKVHFGRLEKLRTLRIQHCSVLPADEEFLLSLKELRRLELVDMSPEDIRPIIVPPSSSFSFPRLSSVFFSPTGEHTFSPYRLLQLAKRCLAAGCPRFTLEVEEGYSGEIFKGIESCFQDGRIRVIESDCSSGLIREGAAGIDSRVGWNEDEDIFEGVIYVEGWTLDFDDDRWDEEEEDESEFDEEDQDGVYST